MADAIDSTLKICSAFHLSIASIIRLVRTKKLDCPELDRLEKLITICKLEGPTFLIDRCKNKIWDSRKQIKTKDVQYFFNSNFDRYIVKGSNYAEFQYALMDIVKDGYPSFTEAEMNLVWKHSKTMLKCVAGYKLCLGEFKQEE